MARPGIFPRHPDGRYPRRALGHVPRPVVEEHDLLDRQPKPGCGMPERARIGFQHADQVGAGDDVEQLQVLLLLHPVRPVEVGHQDRGVETPAFRPGRKRRFTALEMSVAPDSVFVCPGTG
jgi:hypothetical protein